MALVGFQRLMVGELHINGAAAHLRWVRIEAGHNGGRRYFVGHLEECLIFALQHQHVGDATEGDAQLDDFRFAGLVRYVANVYDTGWFACVA